MGSLEQYATSNATSNGFPYIKSFVKYPSRSVNLLDRLKQTTAQHEPPHVSPVSLNVLVVGAGLGGLSTAVALAHRGHVVTVLEQAPALGEVGAGIQIPSNSARLLLSWGIGPYFEGRTVQPENMIFRRWENGATIGYTRLVPDFIETYGAPYIVVHRADFHSALCALAHKLGVKIITDSKVVEYDENVPSVKTTAGREYHADLVVAADGVRSIARSVVLGGEDEPARATGFAVYRATVRAEAIKNDNDTSWLLERPNINLWIGQDRHVITYCIAGGKSLNIVLSHVDRSDPTTWSPKTAISDMKKQFEDWDPRLKKVIGLITETSKWPLLSGADLRTWISKSQKLLILGDAAHAMLPYMSQGAAMAVEDGAALAEALSLARSKEQLPKALGVFEQERMERAYGMQSASLVNGKLWHFADGDEQRARDRGMRAEVEGKQFYESTNQWSDPVTQIWAYGYDAEHAIRERWESVSQAKKY